MTTLRTPGDNEPLALWLNSALADIQQGLTTDGVRRSLGNQAEHAFTFDGVEFLIEFLQARADRGASERLAVVDGVLELAANSELEPRDRRYTAHERHASSSIQAFEPASLDQALEAAQRFYLLARASLETAKFGGPERAADIAVFETFRLASIAAMTDSAVTADEATLLLQIMSWHGGGDAESDTDMPAAFANGVALVDAQLASFAHHSLVLRITSSTTTVAARLQDSALEVLNVALRLDGVTELEAESLTAVSVESGDDLTEDLALIRDSIFIIPRGRGGHLRPDAEFDKLWALYRQAVPWSTPDRRTRDES